MTQYRTVLADPPWEQPMMGQRKRRPLTAKTLPYPTMPLQAIKDMPIRELAAPGCHLWLWTTNAFLRDGFDVMEAWGFKYLAPIHWVKPSGAGNYILHRTQTLLFGYKNPCRFERKRYFGNVMNLPNPKRHSEKPDEFYELIESVSEGPRLELFARRLRPNWHSWGNEIETPISLELSFPQTIPVHAASGDPPSSSRYASGLFPATQTTRSVS